ncbi:MAG TPA: DUF4340 domain-containing protein, partial [Methylotenera sp.]|nr:DUF4340 domain-containing protein [Methylotenera sp.]
LNELTEVNITAAGSEKIATLQKAGDAWVVAERSAYPADVGNLRKQLLALSEARIIEKKTANRDLYHRLGVQDISKSDAGGHEIRLVSPGMDQQVIIGNSGPQINSSRYVRLSNERSSWLIDRGISVDQPTADWLQKDLFDISSSRIAQIRIEGTDGSVVELKNTDPKTSHFEAMSLLKDSDEFAEALIHQVTNALDSFQLIDVMLASEFPADAAQTSDAKYTTFDGIVLKITTFMQDGQHYARIKCHFDEEMVDESALQALSESGTEFTLDTAKALVMQVRAKTDNRVFMIPNVSHDALAQTYENMLVIIDE